MEILTTEVLVMDYPDHGDSEHGPQIEWSLNTDHDKHVFNQLHRQAMGCSLCSGTILFLYFTWYN